MNHVPFSCSFGWQVSVSILVLDFACKLVDQVFTNNWKAFNSIESTEKRELVRLGTAGKLKNCLKG